ADRVVLTGFGVFSSIGIGAEEFAEGLRAGRSGARPITVFDTEGFLHANGCEVPDFRPEDWIRRLPVDELGRASQFSVAAAGMAVADAGLDERELADKRGLIAIGTTDGESHDLDRMVEMELESGPERIDPALARRAAVNRLSAAIAHELQLSDVEAVTIPQARSARNHAIGYGLDAGRAGVEGVPPFGAAPARI